MAADSIMELPPYFSTQGHLLLCLGPRCSRAGSPRLYRDATAEMEKRRLAYYKDGGTVRLTESGCLGACESGPTMACYRDVGDGKLEQAWYCGTDIPLLLRVADAIQHGTDLPDERRYDR